MKMFRGSSASFRGNATYVRELASEVPTETKFERFDPRNTLRTDKFNYTWDFGNGEVLYVHHKYLSSGNYTLRLRVGAQVNKSSTPLTGVYTMDITVLASNNLLFILPCAGIILAILAFITVIASRPKKGNNNNSQMSGYSNATYSSIKMDLQPHRDIPDISTNLYVSRAEKGEVQTLLLQHGTRADAYSYRNQSSFTRF
ncbi:uncharacterized protein tmem130 isoform X3 [Oncorhynchus kisutch]|uniref:uncharacterized protein tmem130 isoform X3 n=1 Tax=Oncorhynchus kisutch TaxID=8019 RepID=UPI0012DD9983|nr:uncharacterized protein LOC109870524 isoform X3 [Oncorhynchus kisutch]XP_031660941.1 uncharacterized protein LOC109870524 isoform X3 [Oncorhynchus kisutch]